MHLLLSLLSVRRWTCLAIVSLIVGGVVWPFGAYASGSPVVSSHPRILLTPSIKAQLLAKKNANDPMWLALKAEADALVMYSILQYKYATRTQEPDNTIFYDYQGSGWYDAAMPLALAFQMTGDTKYSDKLLALADEMLRAQSDPANNPPNGRPPLQPDNYYPTRYLGPVIAIIFDWCYDQLGATRKAQLVSLMNAYFDDLRANAYQANDHADGNYFGGHLAAAAFMGYASYGDNSRAQEMIDYARLRFDGTPSNLVDPSNVPETNFAQLFEGGYKPDIALGWNGPNITTAPFKGGFDFQGWAYGTGNYVRIIDYLLVVKSATGEDLVAQHSSWFSQILRAQKHALLPNHFEIDPMGDWGGNFGDVIIRSLPIRIAYVLAGTPDGPGAQHFASAEIAAHSPYPDFYDSVYQKYFQPSPWENFYFTDMTRPSEELTLPPYYTGFGPAYPQAGQINGALPYFIMRSDWGTNATWASLSMGAAYYDDHQHHDAGSFSIKHGNDYLLIDASNWKGDAGSIGIVGSSTEADATAAANTLWLNDFGDFQNDYYLYSGGQGFWGKDEIVADEQNDTYSYVRGDLSTAYNRSADPADQVGRPIEYFYRSFLYLRSANLFISYDQVKAKNSTNPLGQYHKHIRWHFPTQPAINGKRVQVSQGASRLYLDTLLPSSASITAIDESHNPDPCDGSVAGCTPYDNWFNNSGTWRIEVKDSNNPLFIPFLTVIQVGDNSAPAMNTTLLNSLDSKMVGAQISQPNGQINIVFFNNQSGQVPTPLTNTSYNFSGPDTAIHTLMGVVPNAKYAVSFANSAVTVVQDNSGNFTASPAGVLQFTVNSNGGGGGGPTSFTLTVSKSGTGSGKVTSSLPGIDCGPHCSFSYANNTVVTLKATPDANATFDGWSGACTNTTGDCAVTMDAAKSVTASFTLIVGTTCPGVTVSVSPSSVTYKPTDRKPARKAIRLTLLNKSGASRTVTEISALPGALFTIVSISPTLGRAIPNGRRLTFTVRTQRGAGLAQATASPPYFSVSLDCGLLPQTNSLLSPVPLSVNELRLELKSGQLFLQAEGAGIASVRLQLFTLGGRIVVDKTNEENSLTLSVEDNKALLPNGIYLYVVSVRGQKGELLRSEVRKIVVIR